ncbi:hypothetical protein RB653_009433 [Dictyostelium firmibasis]|uniref:Leucine-rich repeat-containing protein n=1 Tax=Dictyostelium firmibasis TaxID=79012 RepID=A0AAN7U129_9MYCE
MQTRIPERIFFKMVSNILNEYEMVSWDSNNNQRLFFQLVCKEWCENIRSLCSSLSLTKSNIIPLFFKIHNFENIKHLEILNVESPDVVTKVICNILIDPKINNSIKQLKSIDLSLSNLSNIHVQYILNALKQNKSIEDLNFEGNQLGDQSIYDISCFLLNNNSIKYLDLQNCDSKNGLACIGMLLSKNDSIISLNWSNNDSNSSIDFLCQGLKLNNSLTTLSLSGCNIDELGAISLGEVLKNNNSIKYIDLSNNQIGDYGLISLSERLRNHPTIKYLDISCNNVSESGFEEISNILQSNQTLKTLKMYQNNSSNTINKNTEIEENQIFFRNSFDEIESMETSTTESRIYYNYIFPRQMIIL